VHGYDGPIHISDGGYRATRAEDEFLKVAASQGYPEILDLQDLKQNNGFSRWQRYVSPDGKRQDTAHKYLHPLLQDGKHPNLHVLLQTKVIRVLFDGNKQACGVEYTPSEEFQPLTSSSNAPVGSVKARKLVVISSGALGSPLVLERSGIGNAEVLKKLDIPVVSDLKGVGENYQDHHLLLMPYKTSLAVDETNDALLSGRLDFAKALEEKMPNLGWNCEF
jgi:alcohol oxidase